MHDFILKTLSKKESEALKNVVEVAAQAVEAILAYGREKAANEFNTKKII